MKTQHKDVGSANKPQYRQVGGRVKRKGWVQCARIRSIFSVGAKRQPRQCGFAQSDAQRFSSVKKEDNT